jgi:diaminopimelate epimerase
MQACGNDFVILDHTKGVPPGFSLSSKQVAKICHRQFGIGCDQLLWLKPGASFEISANVAILNADGSSSEMCGNGMRAIGVHLQRRGLMSGKSRYSVRTEAGAASLTVEIDLTGRHPEVALGTPKIIALSEKLAGNERFKEYGDFVRVDMGNPHAVFFLDENNLSTVDLEKSGREIETHPSFPNRTNVEFVSVLGPNKIRVRVWERGAGATLACGSGACAVVAAAEARGLIPAGEKIEVLLPGGSVYVRLEKGWRTGTGRALLSGPAEDVFSGEWCAEEKTR